MAREYTHEDYDYKTSSKILTIKDDSSMVSQHALDVVNRRVRYITKVRSQLRGDDDYIYAPQYMPIGPCHLDISSREIEKEKMRSVRLLKSLSDEAGLRALMEKLEPLARKCYADNAGDMMSEQFMSMLLNDGCYLLLFFVDYVSNDNRAPPCDDDEAPVAAVSRNTLVRDTVFLLENQIPLVVLQRLHEHVTGGTTSVVDCIAEPVQELLQKMFFISKKPRHAPPHTCSHLLHLVHTYFEPTLPPVPGKKKKTNKASGHRRPTGRWRRAAEYMRYGNVCFRVREFADDVASSILDVQLRRGGTVWVPRLRVDSNTWTILRNLMALEEQEEKRPVTAYCLFMSHVACTAEDVELLRRAGIVDHFLSNDEQAAQGFAELCRGVVMEVDDGEKNYLRSMWHELEERCDSRAQRLMGWFRHGQNVWVAVAVLVALILLTCQVTQTLNADGAGSSNGGPDFDLEAQHIEMVRQTGSTGPQQLRHAAEVVGAPGSSELGSHGGQGPNSQTQQTVAIIPKIHYYSFPWMEEKRKAVDHLKRLMGDARFEDLKTMLAQLWPQQVRRFYTHLPIYQEDDPAAAVFGNMLLHDGCYLLSLFFEFEEQRLQGNNESGGGDNDDPIIVDAIDSTLVRDILYLLENQIPLFVLQEILNYITPAGHEETVLNRIASNVTTLLQTQLYISNRAWEVPSESSDLLHLVHSYFRHRPPRAAPATQPGCWPLDQGRPRVAQRQKRLLTGKWRRATDYSRYANLRFRPRTFSEDGAWTVLDIDLQGGTLWMPRLRVDSNTWTMLRNLMAMEEQEDQQRPVTAYCLFMSQVACTPEDIELLQGSKVLEHFLGTDEQVAKGFAELCDGVAFDIDKPERNYLRKMWHDLDERCRKPGNNFQGFFRQRYCGNVFYRMVFFMALILNICQMIQAIYAVVGYHKPSK
nr:unnamed protein product [Digitaria exilis]CAB3503943.1 unnamed protein product [Digitaria exilis]